MLFLINFAVISHCLTHWGRVTHICVSDITIIGSNNGLLLIEPLGTNFSEILIQIFIFSFKKMHLKMSSGSWRPFWLCLNVLIIRGLILPGSCFMVTGKLIQFGILFNVLVSLGLGIGLYPIQCQAIIKTKPALLWIGTLGTKFCGMRMNIQ